jgi:hypothetical protein
VFSKQLIWLALITAAVAQQPRAASPESLAEAWWTGPMLAPSANTLPSGHFLLEPYLYDVVTAGAYNSAGTRVSAPHGNGFGSLTYALYGLANKFTVGMIPTFGYNQVSKEPNSGGVGVGDLSLQAQYRLHLLEEGRWLPTTSIAVEETLPTGKYDHLGNRPTDGLGGGAFTTTIAVYTQTFFWMPNGRILRARLNFVPAFSRSVNVEDVSVYGTGQGFRGRAQPGSSSFVDLAAEYSMTRCWVLAMDATYRHQGNTLVKGYNITDPNVPFSLNSGTGAAFGLAPAIEYNWKSNLGVLVGARPFPAGRNTARSGTPALAINYVH